MFNYQLHVFVDVELKLGVNFGSLVCSVFFPWTKQGIARPQMLQ